MYLKKSRSKGSNRTFLEIAKKYRDPITKKPRDRIVKSIGYLDDLEKEFEDPIAHFKMLAAKMTEEEKESKQSTLSFSIDEELELDTDNRRNYGYVAIMKIYHDLLLHDFLAAKARYQRFGFNTNSIMLLLVISRILYPGSKNKAFADKGRYFERFDFELEDIYRALTHFAKIGPDLQKHLHDQITSEYGRDTSIIYYDTTNFYFEIDQDDDLRKRGVSKEHRPNPIVQMGLAMDRDGVPIDYKIFPGNKLDSETFKSIIGEICRNYETGRVIVVGDKGIITGDNIWYLIGGKPSEPRHGYVFSFSVRGGTDEFKKYVLDETGYTDANGNPPDKNSDYKIKTRIIARKIDVTRQKDGKKMKKIVYEKQVVYWSKDYAMRAKAEREPLIKRAQVFIDEPSRYKRHIHHGSAKYITGVDKETGEVEPESVLMFNDDVLTEDEKYDGYYCIVTSELEMDSGQIIDTYRGLWEIEESFRITKGDLEGRPVYVSKEDHIDAHFLTCFISLIIVRLLQKITGYNYSVSELVDTLKRISCSNEHENIYLFDYRSAVTDEIGKAVGIEFKKKRKCLGDIKTSNIAWQCKKVIREISDCQSMIRR